MTDHPPIAIVGLSAIFPGSPDGDGFWRDILAGADLFEEVPPTHWLLEDYHDPDPEADDQTYARRGGFVPDVEFEPVEFGVPPNSLPATDTSQLLTLLAARRLLDDALEGEFDAVDRERAGVVLGVSGTSELTLHMAGRMQQPFVERALRRHGLDEEEVEAISDRFAEMYVPWQENTFPGLLGNVVAGRVANRFDLGGTNCTLDAACASSLAALEAGVHKLHLDEADLIVTGGVDVLNEIVMHMCFSETGALSTSGDCRPFSADADGTLLAEGVGLFALKRLADAEADGNRIHAVIRGVGSSSDGRAKSIYAPRPDGQARALRRAYDRAGYSPRTVELLEAHGTATTAGDAAEMEGLKTVFEEEADPTDDRAECALGSVKSQIGHAKAAAGAAGLFKAVRAVDHGVLPPTIKVDRPNPDLGVDETMFSVNTASRPWIRGSDHPRRASVSSFGFGGTNFHLTIEEYDGPAPEAPRVRTLNSELFVLSADDPAALADECAETADELGEPGTARYLARDSQRRFDADRPARLAVVADGESALAERLDMAADRIDERPEDSFSAPNGIHYTHGDGPGELALMFPGQGSQYLGMGRAWAMHFEQSRAVWDRAADLDLDAEYRLHDVVFPPPAFDGETRDERRRRLTATEWAQPAIGAASASLLRLLESAGLEPSHAAGHSYGEVVALHAAGAMDERAMLEVSRRRGELMAQASDQPGAMLAVRTDADSLRSRLDEWDADVVVANHNAPEQVVLSGRRGEIDAVEDRLADSDVSCDRLPVDTAFHSSLVSDSTSDFRSALDATTVSEPPIDVYSNARAEPYPPEPEAIREVLADQIARPVQFVDQIRGMYDRGARTFLEVGPGDVLTNLVDRCLGDRPHRAIAVDRRDADGVEPLWNAVGQLAVAGVDLDFDAFWKGYRDPEDPREQEESDFSVEINGANVGKPYPPEDADELVAPGEQDASGREAGWSESAGDRPEQAGSGDGVHRASSSRRGARPP
ncbi:MAG: beta-ketoacyl synthase N-terminal-like domain-containing protein, partial [Bradymonadaceae bacterium]